MRTNLVTVIGTTVLGMSLFFSGPAWAGAVNHGQVYVSPRGAFGSTYGARHHPSRGQYIGCDVESFGGTPRAKCIASTGVRGKARSCSTTNWNLVQVAKAIPNSAQIRFTFNADGKCTYIGYDGGSRFLP